MQSRWLIALAVLTACAVSAPLAPAPEPVELELSELKWLPPGIDRVAALTRQPQSCVIRPTISLTEGRGANYAITVGEVAFNSPALLGGRAEKLNLSCGSCHRNGRNNPHFQIEAVSDAPGTADVTSGLFSRIRADNVFNPVPIPDLALPDGQDQVDRHDIDALRAFTLGQIVEEFSGDVPSDFILGALLAYLNQIDAKRSECDVTADIPIRWQEDWDRAREAGLLAFAKRDDPQIRTFAIRSARKSLERLHNRYIGPENAELRTVLETLSRDLRDGEPWPSSSAREREIEAALAKGEATSLYNPNALAKALGITTP